MVIGEVILAQKLKILAIKYSYIVSVKSDVMPNQVNKIKSCKITKPIIKKYLRYI